MNDGLWDKIKNSRVSRMVGIVGMANGFFLVNYAFISGKADLLTAMGALITLLTTWFLKMAHGEAVNAKKEIANVQNVNGNVPQNNTGIKSENAGK